MNNKEKLKRIEPFYLEWKEVIDRYYDDELKEKDVIEIIKSIGTDIISEDAISCKLDDVFEYLKYFDDDRCGNCARIIEDEDFISNYEEVGEYLGLRTFDNVISGYKCGHCCHYKEF